METDEAKADFAKGVAATLDGVDESDIRNIVVTEVFTERRLKELDPDLYLGGWLSLWMCVCMCVCGV